MGWKAKMTKEFPSAARFERFARAVQGALIKRDFNPANTLFANALCRDEINQPNVESLSRFWGEYFDLSGLGGFPSAGVTGFSAYAQHVSPEDGRLFVLYGPHLGVDIDGNLGRTLRKNMQTYSSACGLLCGFVDKVKKDPSYTPSADPLDLERVAMENELVPFVPGIVGSASPLKAAVESSYEVIESHIDQILAAVAPKSPVALIGGIMINTAVASGDYFAPRCGVIRRFDECAHQDENILGEILEYAAE